MPYLSASAVVIHYQEALYQVYAPLPLTFTDRERDRERETERERQTDRQTDIGYREK